MTTTATTLQVQPQIQGQGRPRSGKGCQKALLGCGLGCGAVALMALLALAFGFGWAILPGGQRSTTGATLSDAHTLIQLQGVDSDPGFTLFLNRTLRAIQKSQQSRESEADRAALPDWLRRLEAAQTNSAGLRMFLPAEASLSVAGVTSEDGSEEARWALATNLKLFPRLIEFFVRKGAEDDAEREGGPMVLPSGEEIERIRIYRGHRIVQTEPEMVLAFVGGTLVVAGDQETAVEAIDRLLAGGDPKGPGERRLNRELAEAFPEPSFGRLAMDAESGALPSLLEELEKILDPRDLRGEGPSPEETSPTLEDAVLEDPEAQRPRVEREQLQLEDAEDLHRQTERLLLSFRWRGGEAADLHLRLRCSTAAAAWQWKDRLEALVASREAFEDLTTRWQIPDAQVEGSQLVATLAVSNLGPALDRSFAEVPEEGPLDEPSAIEAPPAVEDIR